MTFWEYLNARENRKMAMRHNQHRIDARGWIGIGVYVLVLITMGLLATFKELRADEFFKTIATLIIGAFIKDVVGFAYQLTKGSSDAAERSARFIEDQARGTSEE